MQNVCCHLIKSSLITPLFNDNPIFACITNMSLFVSPLFGAVAKLQKATICFVMSVRLSVRMEQLDSHQSDFDEILYLSFFRKSVKKVQVSFKSGKNKGHFKRNVFKFMTISCWIFLRITNVLDQSCRQNQNTHFTLNNVFIKILPFMR